MEQFCDQHDIYLEVIAGEAHWQLGVREQAIGGTKAIKTKLVDGDPELPPEQALCEALRTCNHREVFRVFSPVQHVLGRAPDETGLTGNLHEQMLANPNRLPE